MTETKYLGDSQPAPFSPEVDLGASTQPPPTVEQDAYVGKVIDGRYLVEAVLGQGGMGIVYRGRHKLIDKRVAIKVLRGEMARNKELTDRFLQEARAASAIGNPHIIDISDFGVLPDGSAYFAMEFLDGPSLTKVMEQSRPLPVSRIVHIAKQIAQGLSAAHLAGIVHRDLKPDNVMLVTRGTEKDFVKVLDFGIAKVTGETNRLTQAGSVFGTPHYMSPEQAAGAGMTHATDIYSLGVMLYELAAGKVPFDAENFMGILTMHMYKAPVPMRALVPAPQEIPAGLDAIVLKCLSKKPEHRYATMDALVADLEKFEKGAMPDAVSEMMARSGGFNVPTDYFRPGSMPPPVPGTPSRRGGRTKWPLIAGLAGVVTAIAIVVVILARSSTTNADAPKGSATHEPTATQAASNTAPAPTVVPSATNAPNTQAVAVAVDPSDAKVTRDGRELSNPVVLHLSEEETATLNVSRPGYTPQTVTVSAKQDSWRVKLAVVGGGGAKPPTTATTKPTGGGGMGGPNLADPFAPKK